MQITRITVFALLGLASASPVKRAASDILSAISTISSQLDTVDGDVNAFTGSILQALPLLAAVTDLENDITSATSTVSSTGALSSSDSANVFTSVTALGAKIATILSDADAKVCLALHYSCVGPVANCSALENHC